MESDEEESQDLITAKKYSSFVLDDAVQSKEKIGIQLTKLLSEVDTGYNLPEEYVRTFNYISFLKWRLGEKDSAFEFSNKARERDKSNIIGLCNQIIFNHENGKYATVKKLLGDLKKLQQNEKFKSMTTKALAEIAYSYSRSGPRFHQKAIEIYTDIIESIKPIQDCSLLFGLALTMRRQAHMFTMRDPKQYNPKKNNEQAAIHFLKIIRCASTDCKHLQAKAWCELGDIVRNKSFSSIFCDKIPEEISSLKLSDCYEKANELCPNNEFVLKKWGQSLRYSNRLEESKEKLEKSLQLRDTTFSRHHLALTLKKIVIKSKGKQVSSRTNQSNMNEQFGPPAHNFNDGNNTTETMPQYGNKTFYPQNNGNSWHSYEPTVSRSNNSNRNERFDTQDHNFHNRINTIGEMSQFANRAFYPPNNRYSWNFPTDEPAVSMITSQSNMNEQFNTHDHYFQNGINTTGAVSQLGNQAIYPPNNGCSLHSPFNENAFFNPGPSFYRSHWPQNMRSHYTNSHRANYRHEYQQHYQTPYLTQISYDSGISSLNSEFSQMTISNEGLQQSVEQSHSRSVVSRPNMRGQRHRGRYQGARQRGCRGRKFNRFSGCETSQSSQHELLFNAVRRSPKEIHTFPNNPTLKEAVEHLNKALELANDFNTARYDLGIIYMMLEEPENALDCFSFIISDASGRLCEYKMLLINCYEQQGLCKLQMAANEKDPDKQSDLQYESTKSLWRAVEVTAMVVEVLPILKETCHSFNTLKDLLLGEKNSKKTKELARLHELLGNYKESIDFYKQVVNENNSDFKCVRKLIDNYIKEGDFNNAIATLSLLRCTKDSNKIDKQLYIETFINGAISSLHENDTVTARLRFMQAFKIISEVRKCQCLSIDDCTCFDVLILHQCKNRDSCRLVRELVSLLENFLTIKVTINSTSGFPFRTEIENFKNIMMNSMFIIAVFHIFEDSDSAEIDRAVKIALDIALVEHMKKTLVINDGNAEHDFQSCKNITIAMESCMEGEPALKEKENVILPAILYAMFSM